MLKFHSRVNSPCKESIVRFFILTWNRFLRFLNSSDRRQTRQTFTARGACRRDNSHVMNPVWLCVCVCVYARTDRRSVCKSVCRVPLLSISKNTSVNIYCVHTESSCFQFGCVYLALNDILLHILLAFSIWKCTYKYNGIGLLHIIAVYPPGLFQSQAFFFVALPTH